MQADKPRRWILGDDVLLDIARRLPKTRAELEKISSYRIGSEAQSDDLVTLLKKARKEPKSEWPRISPYQPLTPQQETMVNALSVIVRLRALQYDLNPDGLIGRKDLETMVRINDANDSGEDDSGESNPLSGWRAVMVGKDLQAFLMGRCRLLIRNGALHLEEDD